jgi:Thioesterase-like superfamily
VAEAYFTTPDGLWFLGTHHARGPWNPHACHAGPPTALVVRALEGAVEGQQLSRVTVDLLRPIPMGGFRIRAEVHRRGRSASTSEAEILDDDRVYARARGMHLRVLDHLDVITPDVPSPDFGRSVPGPFPIAEALHDLPCFPGSMEVRYDPAGSLGGGGPTTVWMKGVPILADEEPSGFQRLCPLADSGNGISYNDRLGRVLFMNTDLTISVHRPPVGEWLASSAVSHWQPSGVGLAEAALFDRTGPVGRSLQTLLLEPGPEVAAVPGR